MTSKGLDDENFYRLTIENRQWKVLQVSGVKPGARLLHTMNFFKQDSLLIFGGQVRQGNEGSDFSVASDLIYFDLKEMDCSTPFIANIGPSPRFGHTSCYNSNLDTGEHIIIGGLDQTYCSMDVYVIKEIELSNDKKWVYEQRKLHSTTNVNYENRDDIFETVKKTIISYKKQIEGLNSQYIEVNKKYSEHFNTLNIYKRNILEEDLTSNEKKLQMKKRKMEIEAEKEKLVIKLKKLKIIIISLILN